MSGQQVRAPRDQPLLAAIAVVATLLVAPVLALAGHLSIIAVFAVLVAAALAGVSRDSAQALAALLIVSVLWLLSGPEAVTPWSLVLATLMLTVHSAVALRSSVPPGAVVSMDIGRRWLLRGGVVVALTALVFVVGLGLHDLERGDSELMVVLALFLLGGLVLLLRSETVRDQP